MSQHDEIANLRRTLQIGLGATAVAAGTDKFFNLLTDWEKYLNPAVVERTGLSKSQFMKLVGVIEITAGLAVLRGFKRSGGYVVCAWLLGITANLVTQGRFLDIAVRDVNMALEAFALARLAGMEQDRYVSDGDIADAELAA